MDTFVICDECGERLICEGQDSAARMAEDYNCPGCGATNATIEPIGYDVLLELAELRRKAAKAAA